MKAEYKRDLQNNYLILEGEKYPSEDEYGLLMAEKNDIPGLLNYHSTFRDGKLYLHYEITSRQSLYQMYEKKLMGYYDIVEILTGIQNTIENLQKYLLNSNLLVFDPEYIYLEPGRNKISLCYFPIKEEEQGIIKLAEFILKRLDHEDQQAVTLGYGFYQRAAEENFSLQKTIQELLFKENSQEKRSDKVLSECSDIDCEEEIAIKNKLSNAVKNTTERSKDINIEDYQVEHKVRKKTSVKQPKLFAYVHPAVLISGLLLVAVLEMSFYFQWINLTETGGLFFFILSVLILVNKYWKHHTDKIRVNNHQWMEEEESELYRLLKEEMYEDTDVQDKESDEVIEETQYLAGYGFSEGIYLNCIRAEGGRASDFPQINLNSRSSILLVGKRKGESDIILDSPTVSRMHARLEGRGEHYFIKDLNSKNGTFLNNIRLEPQEQIPFSIGDHIRFAEIEYQVYKN